MLARSKRRFVGFAVACVLASSARVAADPAPSTKLRMREPSELHVASGRILELPPGRYVEENVFQADEAERVRLQNVETKLTAENASLRDSMSGWVPGWKTVLVVAVAGFAGGVYIHAKFD